LPAYQISNCDILRRLHSGHMICAELHLADIHVTVCCYMVNGYDVI